MYKFVVYEYLVFGSHIWKLLYYFFAVLFILFIIIFNFLKKWTRVKTDASSKYWVLYWQQMYLWLRLWLGQAMGAAVTWWNPFKNYMSFQCIGLAVSKFASEAAIGKHSLGFQRCHWLSASCLEKLTTFCIVNNLELLHSSSFWHHS